MERMDEVLSYWVSKVETFPEALRTREETGCCTPIFVYDVSTGSEPEHAGG